jgi:hypothetical protein
MHKGCTYGVSEAALACGIRAHMAEASVYGTHKVVALDVGVSLGEDASILTEGTAVTAAIQGAALDVAV